MCADATLIESCFGAVQGVLLVGDTFSCEHILWAPAKYFRGDMEVLAGPDGDPSAPTLTTPLTAVARAECSLLQVDAYSLRRLLLANKLVLQYQPGGVSRTLRSDGNRSPLETEWVCALLQRMNFLAAFPLPSVRALAKVVVSRSYAKGEIGAWLAGLVWCCRFSCLVS